MASTGLLAPVALGFRVRRRCQPSVSLSICRVAVLGGSLRQLTLSQNSQGSANSGTPRSSCICLLLTYQGALWPESVLLLYASLPRGLLRHWSVERAGGRGLPDEFWNARQMVRARERCGPIMGRAFDCEKEMNWARKIAAVENAADGLRKGMRLYVGVTTSSRNSSHLMESIGPLPYSQQPPHFPYSKPGESNQSPSCFNINFNIVFLSTFRSSKWFVSFRVLRQNPVCVCLSPYKNEWCISY
jgi:hypothetical protein